MNTALIILVVSQLLFSVGDVLARSFMVKHGFTVAILTSPWFWVYVVLRIIASAGQLFVLANFQVGKTIALFGALAIIMSSLLGWLLLQEVLSPATYVGIVLAVLAFLILAFR